MSRDHASLYRRRLMQLEASATVAPADLTAQLALLRYLVTWNEKAKASKVSATVAAIAPRDPEFLLLEARRLLNRVGAGYDLSDLAEANDAIGRAIAADRDNSVLKLLHAEVLGRIERKYTEGSPVGHGLMQEIFRKLEDRPIDVEHADLTAVYLSYLDIDALSGTGSDWRASVLKKVNLSNADLSDAHLRAAYWTEVDLSGSDLSHAAALRIRFIKATLTGANLRNAELTSATIGHSDLRATDLSGADLRKASVYYSDLRRADLIGADLGGANFSEVDLRGADLTGATIGCQQLKEATLDYTTRLPNEIKNMTTYSACIGWEMR